MEITIEIDRSDYTASQIEALVRNALSQHTDLIVQAVFSDNKYQREEDEE